MIIHLDFESILLIFQKHPLLIHNIAQTLQTSDIVEFLENNNDNLPEYAEVMKRIKNASSN